MKKLSLALAVLAASAALAGCQPDRPKPSGFLSNYQTLQPAGDNRMRYISPKAKQYTKFIVDPVQVRFSHDKLTPEDTAKVARELKATMEKVLTENNLQLTTEPGVGVARLKMAFTNIKDSAWWMKIHPASRMTGAGQGGAAMEAEVIDSVTGEQIAAVMRSDLGSQLNPGSFGTVSDIENCIDKWSKNAGETIAKIHGTGK